MLIVFEIGNSNNNDRDNNDNISDFNKLLLPSIIIQKNNYERKFEKFDKIII